MSRDLNHANFSETFVRGHVRTIPGNTPAKLEVRIFRFRFRTSMPNFVEIGSKLRPWEHGQTHRHTDRDHTSDLI